MSMSKCVTVTIDTNEAFGADYVARRMREEQFNRWRIPRAWSETEVLVDVLLDVDMSRDEAVRISNARLRYMFGTDTLIKARQLGAAAAAAAP